MANIVVIRDCWLRLKPVLRMNNIISKVKPHAICQCIWSKRRWRYCWWCSTYELDSQLGIHHSALSCCGSRTTRQKQQFDLVADRCFLVKWITNSIKVYFSKLQVFKNFWDMNRWLIFGVVISIASVALSKTQEKRSNVSSVYIIKKHILIFVFVLIRMYE